MGSATARGLAAALLLSLAAAPAAGQDGLGPPPGLGGDEHDHQGELVELFGKVERELRRIDAQLADAGAGEVPLEAPPDSGLADLLRDSRRRSDEVVRGIDAILELASGGS